MTDTLYEDLSVYMIISPGARLRVVRISDKICRENQNTFHIQYILFRNSCRLWDNVEKYGTARQATDGDITRCMLCAYRINKATDTHSEYTIVCFSMATIVTRTSLNIVLRLQYLFFFRKIIGWQWSVNTNISLKIIKVIITGNRCVNVNCIRTQKITSLETVQI